MKITYPKQIIHSDIPSKANAYRIINIKGHSSLAKTKTVKEYEENFYKQCSLRDANITNMFIIKIDCYFGSNRKDLDGCFKLLLDCLQLCNVIKNDRQCVEIHARKLVDKVDPRIEFVIETIEL